MVPEGTVENNIMQYLDQRVSNLKIFGSTSSPELFALKLALKTFVAI